jgi:hypothetical protein
VSGAIARNLCLPQGHLRNFWAGAAELAQAQPPAGAPGLSVSRLFAASLRPFGQVRGA